MKKIRLIFGIAGCIFLANGINNANAVGDQPPVVINASYTCPAGCHLESFFDSTLDITILRCVSQGTYADGTPGTFYCNDPVINISGSNAVLNLDNAEIIKANIGTEKIKTQNAKQVSARSAETPKMVKKIVYEQVMEE